MTPPQTSLNYVTTAHVSATTATMTATMTYVSTTRNATTKAPQYQLTQAQHKTTSTSILHPTITMANYATPRNLLLFFVQNNPEFTLPSLLLYAQIGSAIMTALNAQNLLLPCIQDDPETTMANHANPKLQLIVGSTQKALIKLIVDFVSVSEGDYAPTIL